MSPGPRLPLLFDIPAPGSSFTDLLSTLGYTRAVNFPTDARPVQRAGRNHRPRPQICRRGRDGRRSPGHGGQPGRPSANPQGLCRRFPLGGRDRRNRRSGPRDGPTVPGRTGALREDRRKPALPRRQGGLSGPAGQEPTADGIPGLGRGATVRGLRRAGRQGSPLHLRRCRWSLRRERLRVDRFGREPGEVVPSDGFQRRSRQPRRP